MIEQGRLAVKVSKIKVSKIIVISAKTETLQRLLVMVSSLVVFYAQGK